MSSNRHLLIISTSTIYGSGYLEYILPNIEVFLAGQKDLLFIPYARPSGITYEEYTSKVSAALATIGVRVQGIHELDNPVQAVLEASSVFIGGGNSFVLLDELYRQDLISPLRKRINDGMRYLGTSAGANMTGISIGTTNDMPIVHPPSFDALNAVPFNINPHYLDPDPHTKHMGETRETRIAEFHHFNDQPVIGLREGSWIEVYGMKARLQGKLSARLFLKGKEALEIPAHSDISYLL
jgi:dipeptidase E